MSYGSHWEKDNSACWIITLSAVGSLLWELWDALEHVSQTARYNVHPKISPQSFPFHSKLCNLQSTRPERVTSSTQAHSWPISDNDKMLHVMTVWENPRIIQYRRHMKNVRLPGTMSCSLLDNGNAFKSEEKWVDRTRSCLTVAYKIFKD